MKKYTVKITDEAEQDLFDIYYYIALNDSPDKAEHVLDKLQALCESLATMPVRGHLPPELDRFCIVNYLEVHYKPYRVIYQVLGNVVNIYGVFDGRRDLQTSLIRRLTR